VAAVDNLIELRKPRGLISIPETLERIGSYRKLSDTYPAPGIAPPFHLVLDIGVPAAARWATKWGVPSVTVFDHAWSLTLEMILKDLAAMQRRRELPRSHRFGAGERRQWLELVQEIRQDEKHVQKLFLFPRFLTPGVFWRHWRGQLGVRPANLGGVLGGEPEWSRPQARKFLRITRPGPTVLIQAGDTPVWDGPLQDLVRTLTESDKDLEANVVIYVPASMPSADFDDAGLKRVRRLTPVPGATIQRVLPAIDFMLTRAGGGSVNDAVACRVPFACVEETGQSQVREILRACRAAGLTRRIDRPVFAADPVKVAAKQWQGAANAAENRRFVARMQEIPRQAERVVVKEILRTLAG